MNSYDNPIIRDALTEYRRRMVNRQRTGSELDEAVQLYDIPLADGDREVALRRMLRIAMNLDMVSSRATEKFRELGLATPSSDPEVKGIAPICWALRDDLAEAASAAFRVFINIAGIEAKRRE